MNPASWFPSAVPHAWFMFIGDDVYNGEDDNLYIWLMNPMWEDEIEL